MQDKNTDIKDENIQLIPVEIEDDPISLEIEILLVNKTSAESEE